jgi:hypothetical protein
MPFGAFPRPASVRWLSLLIAGWLLSCSSGGGCAGCLDPIPNGHYQGERLDSAAAMRITSSGFGVINADSSKILERFAPGQKLTVPLKCSISTTSLLGFINLSFAIGDQGAAGCAQESCGLLDGKCDAKDVPISIPLTFNSLSLNPKAPDQLEVTLDLTFSTGKIMISTTSRSSPLCLFTNPAKCGIDFDSSRGAPNNNQMTLGVKFTVDTRWGKLLKMEVGSLNGTQVCGTTGASPKPACLDSTDLIITAEGSCPTCTAADWTPVKVLLMDQIAKSLQDALQDALDDMNCRKCAPGGACPQNGAVMSSCDALVDGGSTALPDGGVDGECKDTMTGQCVPAIFGVEGRMNVATPLGGSSNAASLDLSFAAGGATQADSTGFTQGFVGGAQSVSVSPCVKAEMAPPVAALPLPLLDLQAPGTYDVGVTLSHQLFNRALFHAQQAGVFCIEAGQETVAQLETSVLVTFLPSLSLLADERPVNGPMHVVVRPTHAPTMSVGEGTFDAMGKIDKPLLTLDWNDVEVDVYAMVYERWTRLFTMSADIKLPLGLQIEQCVKVTPVLGDLKGAITDVKALNSEILAENVSALENLVPALITLVEPMLASGLPGFDIPETEGYQLHLLAAKGVGPITGTATFNHMGIYGRLKKPMDVCDILSPAPLIAAGAASRDGSKLTVRSGAVSSSKSYSIRIDKGFWSAFQKPAPDGTVSLEHPKLLLGLGHVIEVRERDDREPLRVSAPRALSLLPQDSNREQRH